MSASAGVDPYGNPYPAGIFGTESFSGDNWVINDSGIFFYSGPAGGGGGALYPGPLIFPGPGVYPGGSPGGRTLLISLASAAGHDEYGNYYPEGLNVTMGSVSGTTFTGSDFTINDNGAFFYTGTPAAGKLIASVTPAGGTDSFGNAYLQGVNAYQAVLGVAYAVGLNQAGSTLTAPGASVRSVANPPLNPAGVFAEASSTQAFAILSSGQENAGDAPSQIILTSQTASGNPAGVIQMTAGEVLIGPNSTLVVDDNAGSVLFEQFASVPAVTGFGTLFANTKGTPSSQTPAGFTGVLGSSESDFSARTNNAGVTLTAISGVFGVPADDAQIGTVYRLTAGGTGTWGGTQENLTLALDAFGVANFTSLPVGAIEFSASTTFQWRYQADVIVTAMGASGSMLGAASFDIGVSGANELTQVNTNQSAGGFAAFNPAQAIDTTSNTNITLQAAWGGASGSITGNYSYLERLCS